MNESQKARLLEIAAKSAIRKHDWTDRGIAPLGYYQGMVLVFGRMYCKLQAGEAVALEAAKADSGNAAKDALTHYAVRYAALGMENAKAGAATGTRRAATTKPAAKDRGLSRRTSAFGESFRGTDIATSWGVDDPPAGGDEQV